GLGGEGCPATTRLCTCPAWQYRYLLRQAAADSMNRQIRSGASAKQFADLARVLRDENKLCFIQDSADDLPDEPQIVCSLGLV
ncbi:MAG: hypothetical protein WCF99_14715, partial [Chloroflexales bacterium]